MADFRESKWIYTKVDFLGIYRDTCFKMSYYQFGWKTVFECFNFHYLKFRVQWIHLGGRDSNLQHSIIHLKSRFTWILRKLSIFVRFKTQDYVTFLFIQFH